VSVLLFIDHAWPLLSELASDFQEYSKGTDVKAILLSEFKKRGGKVQDDVYSIC